MPHPLVAQLRFTRSEFRRALVGLGDAEARKRFLPMNCISWSVGHLAWQEQRYFLTFAQGSIHIPAIDVHAYNPTDLIPPLTTMIAYWESVTITADAWLDQVTDEILLRTYTSAKDGWTTNFGNLLQRVIYHYWFHIGENLAIRQMLGHQDLPEFVGNLDDDAPYQ